jgi:hypothetical protein
MLHPGLVIEWKEKYARPIVEQCKETWLVEGSNSIRPPPIYDVGMAVSWHHDTGPFPAHFTIYTEDGFTTDHEFSASGQHKVTATKALRNDAATPRVALMTGITGQDGSYLAELLLAKGYTVHGIVRRSSSFNRHRIDKLPKARLFLHYGDLSDGTSCLQIIEKVRPDEIYNLAAQSHVQTSFETSEYTGDIDGLGVLRLLNGIRAAGLEHTTRFYQASTSELFGRVREVPQSELTPFYPRSPYGVAKQYGYWIVVNYREANGMHASNGILFNHESPVREPSSAQRCPATTAHNCGALWEAACLTANGRLGPVI